MVHISDKRIFPRVRFQKDVVVNDMLAATGASLSVGGMFVYTMGLFRPENPVRISFPLGEHAVAMDGQVRHYQSGIGMGIMFMHSTETQMHMLKEYVDAALKSLPQCRRKAVLLVDSNEARRRLYRAALTQSHYQVVEATTVGQAFDILKSGCVSVMVFDPHLPGGFSIAKRMRANPAWTSIVPVVLSNRPVSEEVRRREMPAVKHLFLQPAMPPMKLPLVIARYLP